MSASLKSNLSGISRSTETSQSRTLQWLRHVDAFLKRCIFIFLMGFSVMGALPASADPYVSYPLTLTNGWNLVGNSLYNTPIDVNTKFGDTTRFTTVWKWITASSMWAFYSPSLAAQGGTALADYCASKGYVVLTTINPGEGYWVNTSGASYWTANPSATTIDLGVQTGIGLHLGGAALSPSWNMVATADDVSPATFNRSLSGATTGCPPNVTTLWAWDSNTGNWYFYAPSLDCAGTLTSYIQSHGYEDFRAITTGNGRGLWVNVPSGGITGATSSYYLNSAAYSSSAVGANIYAMNTWYETVFSPVGVIPAGSRITSASWSYSTSSSPNQPTGFEAYFCWKDQYNCVTAISQYGITHFFDSSSANNNFLLRYRVVGTGTMSPVYGNMDQVIVNYDYPVYVSSGGLAAMATTTTSTNTTGSTSSTSTRGNGKDTPPAPR